MGSGQPISCIISHLTADVFIRCSTGRWLFARKAVFR